MYLTSLYLLFCGSAFPPSGGNLSVKGCGTTSMLSSAKENPDMCTKGDSVCFVKDFDFLSFFLLDH